MLRVDGLECSRFDREVLQELREGGMDCVTVTVGFWEDAGETMDLLGYWRDLERNNRDLITIARTVEDVEAASRENRTAIILGSQNTSCLDERLRYVELFHDMGIRVLQLTYNNQNAYGGSCYEQVDPGLSRFGKELVREMNRVGMIVDLSHVGERTGLDALAISETPVAVTHANPRSIVDHPRNKSDELLKALVEGGGVLGLATYRNIAGSWSSSLDSWCELVARSAEIVGVDHVGIGTDLSRKTDETELNWMRQGRWTRTTQYGAGSAENPGKMPPPEWLESTAHFPQIAEGLSRQGFNTAEVNGIMGENWMRFYRKVLS